LGCAPCYRQWRSRLAWQGGAEGRARAPGVSNRARCASKQQARPSGLAALPDYCGVSLIEASPTRCLRDGDPHIVSASALTLPVIGARGHRWNEINAPNAVFISLTGGRSLIGRGLHDAASYRNESGSCELRWHLAQAPSQTCGRHYREPASRILTSDPVEWPKPLAQKHPRRPRELDSAEARVE
jgi:hypothetical protein